MNLYISIFTFIVFLIFAFVNNTESMIMVLTCNGIAGFISAKHVISKTSEYKKKILYFWGDVLLHIVPMLYAWTLLIIKNKPITYNSLFLALIWPLLYYMCELKLVENSSYSLKIRNPMEHIQEHYGDTWKILTIVWYIPILLYALYNK